MMRNTNREVREVKEVKEVKDEESAVGSCLEHVEMYKFRKPLQIDRGKSFTSCTSFTSLTSSKGFS